MLLNSMNGIIWEADPESMEIISISENVTNILGYTPQQWLSSKSFWLNNTYVPDRHLITDLFKDPGMMQNKVVEFRMLDAEGRMISLTNYTSPVYDGKQLKSLAGVMIDTTQRTLLEKLEHLEKLVLELNADNNSKIEDVLVTYVLGIENIFPDMRCSILRIQDGCAYNWASPSLPAAYVTSISGLTIGPDQGSCGTAAYTCETVIVPDIEHDSKWTNFKNAAIPYGLKACWSQPIINSEGEVMATFAMYYNKVKIPGSDELAFIIRAAAILKVIMENKVYARKIQQMHTMAMQGQELANFGTWEWDFKSHEAIWSDSLYKIYGLRPKGVALSYEHYLSLLHPDDRYRVKLILDKAHETKSEVSYEERIVRADGSIRELKSWFKVMTDDNGYPLKFIGASLDITQAKDHDRRMQDIAWQQSHVVRAPLARIMGLANLINDGVIREAAEQRTLLHAILESANELDNVIRSITYNTVPN